MAEWYEIKAKANNVSEIFIYGDIGDSWNSESVTARSMVTELNALDASEINVRINSIGGSVIDGLAIYNAFKRHSAKINVFVDGVALSIASLIAMAGDTVTMADNALMMIHAPWAGAQGNAADFREAADTLDRYAVAMSSSYADKTGKTTEEVSAWLTDGKDHWFSADEALAEGLIDTVGIALPVKAQFNLNRFKTIPAAAGIFIKPLQQEITMTPEEIAAEAKAAAAANQPAAQLPAAQPSAAEIKVQVLAAETQRRTDISAKFQPFAKMAGVSDLMTQCSNDSNIDVHAAVEKLHLLLGKDLSPTAANFNHRIETGESDNEKFAKGIGQSIMARCGKEKHDPTNEFRGYRLEDVARACLERAGHNVKSMDRLSMIKAALSMRPSAGYGQTTSDFPVLMENVMHRQVLTAYHATPDTWSQFCVTGSVSDFRDWQRLRVGSIGDIELVNEQGEYRNKVIPDAAKESIAAVRRGNIISITPEVIINDDIGFISSLTTNLGRAGKRTIETKVFTLLAANPLMKDGVALFDAAHGNLADTAAAPSVVSLDAARVAMAQQQDIGKNEYLDIRPNIWLGGLGLGGDVRVLVGAQYDPDTANKLQRPNKINGLVQNIVDTPRISGTAWYLFADPSIAPVIEVVFLDGQSEPLLAMEESFNTGGVNYRVELPFGVGAIGYEGAYKNAGA